MEQTEIWKDIKDYEGLYQVSNIGNVRSLNRLVNSKNNSTAGRKGRLLKLCVIPVGYLRANLYKRHKRKICAVHRLVAIEFLGTPSKGQQVNHKNGIKTDNRVDNLEWVTQKENVRHAFKAGLVNYPKGVNRHNAKLNDDKVRDIRRLYSLGHGQQQLAKQFEINSSVICDIVNNKKWKHVTQ